MGKTDKVLQNVQQPPPLKKSCKKGVKLSKEQLDEFIDSIKEKLNLKKDQEVIIDDEPNTTEEV